MDYGLSMRRKTIQLWGAGLLASAVAIFNGAAAQQGFTFQALEGLIAAHQVQTVEELLAVLPAELRSHYVLVFASRSLQQASLRNPRVILFGEDARLILTFNGDSGQRGYDSVETLEFEPVSSAFVLREIRFDLDGPLATPRVSEANPRQCTACHDTPARPIWDTPPSWPGVYGERYGAGLSGAERRGMEEFLALQAGHPRYRYLLGASAWLDRGTYVADARSSYDGKTSEPPNAQLSALLASLNVESILAQLARQPGFSAHLEALLGAAADTCGPIADFYPDSLRERISRDYQRFAAATVKASERQQALKSARRGSRSEGRHGLAAGTQMTALRFVAEYGLHTPTQHWTLAFERGSYDLSAPPGALSFEQALFNWLAAADPELRTSAAFRTYGPHDAYCEHLKRRSRASLGEWYRVHPMEVPSDESVFDVGADSVGTGTSAVPSLLQTCVGCHNGVVGPAIPFADPVALRGRLRAGHYPHGDLLEEILYRLSPAAGSERMPRGLDVDATQQHQLEIYFMSLSR